MILGMMIDCFGPLNAVRYGRLLERNGFDSVWLSDHLVDLGGGGIVDPWTVGAAIAVKTKRILICSAVTDVQRIHPANTAHLVANLDTLSRGRAVLGIGAGEAMNIQPFGIKWEKPAERAARVKEAIEVIKLLWASTIDEPAHYQGHFYTLNAAFLDQHPTRKPHPPVYVGALGSERMLRVVGEHGDGWMGWINTPKTLKDRAEKIGKFAEAAARKFEDIQPATMLHVALSDDNEELKKAVDRGKIDLLSERLAVESLGFEPPQFPHLQRFTISKRSEEDLKRLAMYIPDEVAYKCMAIGGEEESIEKIEALAKAGATHIAIIDLFSPRRSKETIERFGKITRCFRENEPRSTIGRIHSKE